MEQIFLPEKSKKSEKSKYIFYIRKGKHTNILYKKIFNKFYLQKKLKEKEKNPIFIFAHLNNAQENLNIEII